MLPHPPRAAPPPHQPASPGADAAAAQQQQQQPQQAYGGYRPASAAPSEPADYLHYAQQQLSPRSRAEYDLFNKLHFERLYQVRDILPLLPSSCPGRSSKACESHAGECARAVPLCYAAVLHGLRMCWWRPAHAGAGPGAQARAHAKGWRGAPQPLRVPRAAPGLAGARRRQGRRRPPAGAALPAGGGRRHAQQRAAAPGPARRRRRRARHLAAAPREPPHAALYCSTFCTCCQQCLVRGEAEVAVCVLRAGERSTWPALPEASATPTRWGRSCRTRRRRRPGPSRSPRRRPSRRRRRRAPRRPPRQSPTTTCVGRATLARLPVEGCSDHEVRLRLPMLSKLARPACAPLQIERADGQQKGRLKVELAAELQQVWQRQVRRRALLRLRASNKQCLQGPAKVLRVCTLSVAAD